MSPPFLTAASTMMCPHGGTVIPAPSSTRAVVGAPILTVADTCVIAGCAFIIALVPSPCVTVQWITPAARVMHGGAPALTAASVGLCLAATQAPQGPVIISATQPRASGE